MEEFAEIIASPTLALVMVYAEWCVHCKAMDSVLAKLKDIQGDNLQIIKIDIDRHPQLALTYSIRSVPTLMIFKAGKQLWRQSRVMEVKELNRVIELLK